MKKTAVILALVLGFSFANVNAENSNQRYSSEMHTASIVEVSPLCKAVATGNIKLVKTLIKQGVDVNTKSNGMLPIHYAAKFNRVDIIKELITAGSEIHSLCDKGYTALRHAQKTKAKDAELFLKRFKR
ncbi:ankyrin repeat domain-containing protein [Ichthyenterobacterium sp. W332]|uniref:Ankyrin repeat domain-containing protein n=1 Tax=Microcosmobacter mediterraneus TaxID=3075607 RepID=A0ABU2YPY5_9FLAO|nr:ankyrin repeat domain-containing protein [Ichthyenterobacterium sp. W332]MDT0559330.1 ankyrin repeat domain-containing protein [Ichthyenterobacterium sp. W332]